MLFIPKYNLLNSNCLKWMNR